MAFERKAAPVCPGGGQPLVDILVGLFLLFVAAKVGEEVARRLGQPAVVGELLGGFVVAIYGHLAKLRWLVAIGIIMVLLATLLFPLALQFFADEPPPPGPRVPIAALFG